MTIKILNLYSGIGGNRKLWSGDIEVIAIENNEEIAKIYMENFPQDFMMITDAHEYLLHNYMNFDFIWSSPPCQTHSSFRKNLGVEFRKTEAKYPDMNLYEEILFLQSHFKGKWVVENVKPYYKPLISAKEIQRHLFWSNFPINSNRFLKKEKIRTAQIPELQKLHDFNLSKFKLKDKRQILRNCVLPELGLHIFECAFHKPQLKLLTGVLDA